MILELLRSLLIDFALDTRNEEMFRRLTSNDWEQHVLQFTSKSEDTSSRYLVMRSNHTASIAAFHLPSVTGKVVFAVKEDEWDQCGWRDAYGFTFYDRLRSAGFKTQSMWVLAEPDEFDAIMHEYTVVHPKNLTLVHPGRKLIVTHAEHDRDGG